MKLYPLRLLPEQVNFDFIRFKKVSYTMSIILSLVSIIWIGIYKFNFGIDFSGGIVIEVRLDQSPDLTKMREVLNNLKIGEVVLQNFGNQNDLSIRVGSNSEDTLMHNIELIKLTLSNQFPYKFEYRKVDFVGPQVGAHLIKSGITALILSFLAIMAYTWARFEWYFGLGILIALLHDAILSLGFMSVMRLDFNLTSIAAILTIIGYSVNDSVVIYDRIRENLRKSYQKTMPQIINQSINETLSRTILTVVTTLLANLALVIFGGEAIHSFSLLVFFGIIVGTYSSIFISAPILMLFVANKFR
ncbi:protein translocase subunit SecF [Rickettsia endosymbiont of Culicoides newsteadi]|uniref:protein translocase subunit SecF n=1 Tax=Rickettsia endosymbiont of Culicoides newsteadi TaxID=1961830 RepID=UPI000B9BF45E|nr:protein translocase subunit SecF [Rickettsia endosymbiont of Culicoides newsteadi]OZG32005.1 protein translocase subunit SecF [Rickettsia endosymbiont of Culicoides newsteadi]